MCPNLSKLSGEPKLAAFTFTAQRWQNDECSQNGLPLTPNSISIFGKFQFLKTINHQNLTKYLDLNRGQHERVVIVSEYCPLRLSELSSGEKLDIAIKIFYHCASGLSHLHAANIIHHQIEPSNILLDEDKNVKLFNYGLHYMTRGENDEKFTSFAIGTIRYMAPEKILGNHGNSKSDVWSLGLIILEICLQTSLWPSMKFAQIARKLLSFCRSGGSMVEKIAREHSSMEKLAAMDSSLKTLLDSCLSIDPTNRPSAEEVTKNEFFHQHLESIQFQKKQKSVTQMTPLERFESIDQIYYLWKLAGGDAQVELKKEGLIRCETPILSIPFLIQQGKMNPMNKSQSLFDQRIVVLSTKNLSDRLKNLPKYAFYPLLYCPKIAATNLIDMQSLPLVIRERNIEYQFYRIILFERLLKGYPYTRDLIIEQAKIDIPPLLRGRIWAACLNVVKDGSYGMIDKVTPNATDRQIDVDIPRCHQYDDFLSSPTGHIKLKRLLKTFVTVHKNLVYWQGLDSLTAAFLVVNKNDEETAFLSLYKFIPKYLHNFFLKDNSLVIKEYLTKFSQLLMFHEPVLAKHLNAINFIPELYTIPWILTSFSHVFPLSKIFHLWDKLILGDSSYPLFIGIAILSQLKITLMESGFNECILLFSDLPNIEIERCVIDSQQYYEKTPSSICHRNFVYRSHELDSFDINHIELNDIQKEICSRISANDLVKLLKNEPTRIVVIDLRSYNDYNRWSIIGSINLPFANISLGDRRLEALNIHRDHLKDKIVVIISTHENACLFAEFLIDCDIAHVCFLHNPINTIHSIFPNYLVKSLH